MLLHASSKNSSKKRVRITGYSSGPADPAADFMRASQAKPSGPASAAASGSSKSRFARSLSRARAAAIHLDVGAIGLDGASFVNWVAPLIARAALEPIPKTRPESARGH